MELVGHYVVKHETIFDQEQEYAAYYRRVKVPPGRYEVFRRLWGGYNYYCVKFPGVVCSNYFGAREHNNEVGRPFELAKSYTSFMFNQHVNCGNIEVIR